MTPFLQAVEHIDRALREGRAITEREIDALIKLRDDPRALAMIAQLRDRWRMQDQATAPD